MTKVTVAIVAALSGLVLALTAAPLAVAKDGDVLLPRHLHRPDRRRSSSSATRTAASRSSSRLTRTATVCSWDVCDLPVTASRIARMRPASRAGRSGSFESRTVAANAAGPDSFRARATRASGEDAAPAGLVLGCLWTNELVLGLSAPQVDQPPDPRRRLSRRRAGRPEAPGTRSRSSACTSNGA